LSNCPCAFMNATCSQQCTYVWCVPHAHRLRHGCCRGVSSCACLPLTASLSHACCACVLLLSAPPSLSTYPAAATHHVSGAAAACRC
jgi:hypothetical protein